ncbi:hypothetical protein NECAME_13486 [Necator americanus]|uniref:Uncharacterized protein n=1 Tax=Necator americanus TaxID=51031 RepID=W2SVJ1_NECAM|nr:hypothetical protein NECAME_13486 [Necator americanus]ETN73548.1 hypothetical protein NECAME_13486 [Necator americanus]
MGPSIRLHLTSPYLNPATFFSPHVALDVDTYR